MAIQTNINGVIKDIKEVNITESGTVRIPFTGVQNENGVLRDIYTDENIIHSIKLTTYAIRYDDQDTTLYPNKGQFYFNNTQRNWTVSANTLGQQVKVVIQITFYDKRGNELTSNTVPKGLTVEYTGSVYYGSNSGISGGNYQLYGYDKSAVFFPLVDYSEIKYIYNTYPFKYSHSIEFFNKTKANLRIYSAVLSEIGKELLMTITINDFVIKKNGVIIKRIVPIFELTQL